MPHTTRTQTPRNLAAHNQRGFILNSSCDGGGPHEGHEVRKLKTGTDSNAILCRACYRKEIAYRTERNRELDPAAAFLLPSWESLAIYNA